MNERTSVCACDASMAGHEGHLDLTAAVTRGLPDTRKWGKVTVTVTVCE